MKPTVTMPAALARVANRQRLLLAQSYAATKPEHSGEARASRCSTSLKQPYSGSGLPLVSGAKGRINSPRK
jgi:hypothetical protein